MNPHGSKWIRPEKRARIYERDDWRCVWCGASLWAVAPGQRTLDHVITRKAGGSNHAGNLVTSCLSCNSARQHMTAIHFAYVIARRLNTKAAVVMNRVLVAVCTELPAQAALFTPTIDADAE